MTDKDLMSKEEVETLSDQARIDGAFIPEAADLEFESKIKSFSQFSSEIEEEEMKKPIDEISSGASDYNVQNEAKLEQNSQEADVLENEILPTSERHDKLEAVVEKDQDTVESQPISQLSALNSPKVFEKQREAAKVFGVSENQLADEFNQFKAEKLFKRLNLMLTDAELSDEAIKEKIKTAILYGFHSVTVLPSRVKAALAVAKQKIGIRSIVSYPLGCDNLKTKYFAIKNLARTKVSAIEICLDPLDTSAKRGNLLVKILKKFKRKALGCDVVIVVETGKVSPSDALEAFRACHQAGIESVKTACGFSDALTDKYNLKSLLSFSEGKLKVEIVENIPSSEEVVSVFEMGASLFSSRYAVEIAQDLKNKLKL